MSSVDDKRASIARGPVQLPPESTLVSDADEEVFLLYTRLAARPPDGGGAFRGLGHVDSHTDTLTIKFEITVQGDAAVPDEAPAGRAARKGPKRKGKNRSREHPQVVEVEVEVAQDKTALRSRKGDTGSVVWRTSVDLAQSILQQYYSRKPDALLNPVLLASSHVLELGAGTGLLGAVLSPLVGRYTVTDLEALMPLIQKNMTLNAELSLPKLLPGSPPTRHSTPSSRQSAIRPNVALEALDWVDLHNASPSSRRSAYTFSPADLLLVVDCIYHPSLLPPLLSTIDHLTVPGKTAVLVVVELRAEDVVRRFFEGWLGLAAGGAWEIWSLGGALQGPYAVWVGWKVVQSASTDAL